MVRIEELDDLGDEEPQRVVASASVRNRNAKRNVVADTNEVQNDDATPQEEEVRINIIKLIGITPLNR